jgi:stress-induced-phosphoprotein 1
MRLRRSAGNGGLMLTPGMSQHFRASRYDAAITSYTAALSAMATPDSAEAASCYNNRAACYSQIGAHHEVVSDAGRVLAIEANNLKALIRRGLAYEALEKYSDALEDMRRARAIDASAEVVLSACGRLPNLVRMKASLA